MILQELNSYWLNIESLLWTNKKWRLNKVAILPRRICFLQKTAQETIDSYKKQVVFGKIMHFEGGLGLDVVNL